MMVGAGLNPTINQPVIPSQTQDSRTLIQQKNNKRSEKPTNYQFPSFQFSPSALINELKTSAQKFSFSPLNQAQNEKFISH
jgi:hypothetical protein